MDVVEKAKMVRHMQSNPTGRQILEIVKRLQQLREAGKTDDEILETIYGLKLPLGVHLAITGKYTILMSLKFQD